MLREGVLINLLNPKLTIFFFAFLPQFVQPAYGAPLLQMQGSISEVKFDVLGVPEGPVVSEEAAAEEEVEAFREVLDHVSADDFGPGDSSGSS